MYNFVLYSIIIYITYISIKTFIRRVKYDIHKVPSPPSYPIIGHMHHFIGIYDKPRFSVWVYKWYQKLGQPPIMLVFNISQLLNYISLRWIGCFQKYTF